MPQKPEIPAAPLPDPVASSGRLDQLVDTARGYAVSDKTRMACTHDWVAFARWCRSKEADPLPLAPELIRLYITDLVAPSGRTRVH